MTRPATATTGLRSAVALVVAATLLSACKTRPYELVFIDASRPTDMATPDLAIPDLAIVDLAVVDIAVPQDLTRIPLPQACEGIFVLDSNRDFSFFDPVKLQFNVISHLACSFAGAPNSMAVDKNGVAYVDWPGTLTGEAVYRVDTKTGVCTPTKFVSPPMGSPFLRFGMGFSSDGPMANTETLYIAGFTPDRLGSLDTTSLALSDIAPLAGSNAELTGTGAGELWGYFPNPPSHFALIDKRTGALSLDMPLDFGVFTVQAWAFAHWSGDFYAFVAANGNTTDVYQIHRDGTWKRVLSNTGLHIVGAGVSTCAPTGLDQ